MSNKLLKMNDFHLHGIVKLNITPNSNGINNALQLTSSLADI